MERKLTPETNEAYQKAKEQLTNDSRQFVTASKLFVKVSILRILNLVRIVLLQSNGQKGVSKMT
jgi:hypothetical protein